jgi:hypothetical protein
VEQLMRLATVHSSAWLRYRDGGLRVFVLANEHQSGEKESKSPDDDPEDGTAGVPVLVG